MSTSHNRGPPAARQGPQYLQSKINQQPIQQPASHTEIRTLPPENTSFLGHTRKALWHTHVEESNVDGGFVFDFKTYTDGADKIFRDLTMSKITFEKDRYETQVKLPGEVWSMTELKLK